jgi:hypothetical protein
MCLEVPRSPGKYFSQSCRIYNQHTKISSFSIYQQQIGRGRNQDNSPIHKSLKKYVGIILTEDMKELYNENCETLKKEIKEDSRRCSWIGRINIVKMVNLLKAIYSFKTIPIKILIPSSQKWTNQSKNSNGSIKKNPNSQSNPKQKEQSWKYKNT